MKHSHQPRRAFTIIEVMLAIGIFSMILISIYSVWTGILKASHAARSAADNAQRARVAMRALEDALTTAQMFTANMPPQNQNAFYTFLADTEGDYGSLSFVAHLPAGFPGVGRFGDQIVRRVTFTVEPDEKEGLNLILRQGPMLQSLNPDYEPFQLVLAKDVQMFGFEFWGQDPRSQQWQWVTEWDRTNALPQLVRIWLALGSTGQQGKAQDFVAKVIHLPATAVPAEWQMPGMGAMGGGGTGGGSGGRGGQGGDGGRGGQDGDGGRGGRSN